MTGLGVLGLLSGLLLALPIVGPSAFWGRSASGATLLGVGILLLVISGMWGTFEPGLGTVAWSSSTKRVNVRKS